MKKLTGVSIFEGITIAKTIYSRRKKGKIKTFKISSLEIEKELLRFKEAISDTKNQIQKLIDSLYGKVEEKDIKILNVHLMMLEDPVFLSDITTKVKLDKLNVEAIVQEVVKKYVGMFKSLNDPVYKQRAIDIEDIEEKLIANLQGKNLLLEEIGGKILVAEDLKPSTLLSYYNKGKDLKGIILEMGGETSHVAILAKTLGIPTIMSVKNIDCEKWNELENVILDTRKESAFVIIEPTEDEINKYDRIKYDFEIKQKDLKNLIGKKVKSRDNININVYANLGAIVGLDNIKKYKPDGIGLFRTEFIYMNSNDFPTENEQFEIYKKVLQEQGIEKELIIRTLDIGGDKKLDYFNFPEENNPFLGLRAIRLSLKNPSIFKTQLRAILRASYYGNLKIMYPMISSLEEIKSANLILEEAKKELREEKENFNKKIEIGIMVEVPSTAIISDILIDEVDFFSIGTNDLTQYILASDRLSETVSEIYDNYHPAVLRSINLVAENAIRKNKKVSVCGEMAGDPMAVLAFLSFGIKDFSMLPSLTLEIKKVIKKVEFNNLETLKGKLLKVKTSKEAKQILKKYLAGVM